MIRKFISKSYPQSINFSQLTKYRLLKRSNSTNKASQIIFGSGILGDLADSSILCRQGGTVVHAVITSSRNTNPTEDFLGLTVDYRDRSYAHGRIPKNHIRRDRHGSDEEILAARIIDRTIRPLFPKGFVDDIQIVVTTHSTDSIHDPVCLAVNAASCALNLSTQPWDGPLGCVRVGIVDGNLKVNPTVQEMKNNSLDLIYAGTSKRPLMIEIVAQEVPEETISQALYLAQANIQEVIQSQHLLKTAVEVKQFETRRHAGSSPLTELVPEFDPQGYVVNYDQLTNNERRMCRKIFSIPESLISYLEANALEEAKEVYRSNFSSKSERSSKEGKLRSKLLGLVNGHAPDTHAVVVNMAVHYIMEKCFRAVILESRGARRIDGRGSDQVRSLESVANILPSIHGSSYFKRGDTHVLCTATLSSREEAKELFPINGGEEYRENFFLHYDFPPYCTGSTGNSTSLNRRMVGHGNLAERGLRPIIPDISDFPYTIRVFSECTSSNGSSSMASVCGGTLALLDAGVPIKGSAAGISIGLITAENIDQIETNKNSHFDELDDFVLLTDILGNEDHYGDMDFKIAGTKNGITAAQLDVKLPRGIPIQIIEKALGRARKGRIVLLEHMSQQVESQRVCKLAKDSKETEFTSSNHQIITHDNDILPTWSGGLGYGGDESGGIKPNCPLGVIIKFDPERKKHLLGPGGEMLKFIEAEYKCEIDLSTEGEAYIFGKDAKSVTSAATLVQDLVGEINIGDVYIGEILELKDMGALVKLTRAQEALLHISELVHNRSDRSVRDMVSVGQKIKVKVVQVEKSSGMVKVSRKALIDPSLPDTLSPEVSPQNDHISPKNTPNFPTLPPVPWDRNFFRTRVASDLKKTKNSSNNQNTDDRPSDSNKDRSNFSDRYSDKSKNKQNDKGNRDKFKNKSSVVDEKRSWSKTFKPHAKSVKITKRDKNDSDIRKNLKNDLEPDKKVLLDENQ